MKSKQFLLFLGFTALCTLSLTADVTGDNSEEEQARRRFWGEDCVPVRCDDPVTGTQLPDGSCCTSYIFWIAVGTDCGC